MDSLTSNSKDFETEDSPEKRRETIIKKSYYKALKELDRKIEQRRKWEVNLVKNTIPKCVLNTQQKRAIINARRQHLNRAKLVGQNQIAFDHKNQNINPDKLREEQRIIEQREEKSKR